MTKLLYLTYEIVSDSYNCIGQCLCRDISNAIIIISILISFNANKSDRGFIIIRIVNYIELSWVNYISIIFISVYWSVVHRQLSKW